MKTRLLSAALTAALALCLAWPADAGAALAKATGGSGLSGTLSSNAAIRKQQLLCDPLDPASGSNSTIYDPAVSTLTRIDTFTANALDGYAITDAFVETTRFETKMLERVQIGQPFSLGFQTGYVQIFYVASSASAQPGVTGILGGFQFMAHAGVVGQNTHSLIFDIAAGVPDDQLITYTNYADLGGRPIVGGGLSPADRIVGSDGTIAAPGTTNPIAPATVSGPLVPEPASAVTAAGLLLLTARRRRRAAI